MKMRVIAVALGYIVGVLAAAMLWPTRAAVWPTIAGIAGVGASAVLLVREWRWQNVPRVTVALAAALAAFPLGYWRTALWMDASRPGHLRGILRQQPLGTSMRLRGIVAAEPEQVSAGRGFVRLRVEAIEVGTAAEWQPVHRGSVRLTVKRPLHASPASVAAMNRLFRPAAYGYRLDVKTRYRPPSHPLNPGAFDYQAFLFENDLVAAFDASIEEVRIIEERRGNAMVEIALLAKEDFLRTFRATIRGPASRLAAAATLGTRRALNGVEFDGVEIGQAFRHAGVGHVLAVSGLHVSIVSLLLYGLFSLTGLHPRRFVPFLIVFLFLFALLTGARPSSVRAMIMNAAVLLALAYLRCNLRSATYVGLAVSSFLILLRHPLTLFSPGFLLSFGAVLSLVILAPPVAAAMSRLRGWSLILAVAWFAVVFATACGNLRAFLEPVFLSLIGGWLWLLINVGTRLNERFPRLWRVGLDRVPATLRYFLAAQLAIQFGMVIPMSAWFFGRIPLGGMFVNLLAIPLVGVLVQLGMLTGLAGLLPGVGLLLAAPLGAATGVVGFLFFRLARLGQACFPFPAAPKPSPAWICAYYGGIGAFLLLSSVAVRRRAGYYRLWACTEGAWARRLRVWAPPVVLVTIGIAAFLPRRDQLRAVHIYAAGNQPQMAAISTGRRTVIINGGDRYRGPRTFFTGIRSGGGLDVETAVITGPDPRLGLWGIAGLLPKMQVRTCRLAVLPDRPDTYLQAIGDAYLSDACAAGRRWARLYPEGCAAFLAAAATAGVELAPLTADPIVDWEGLRLRALPKPRPLPDRFVASARTRTVELQTGAFRWLVISDAVPSAVAGMSPCDILVLPALTFRPYGRRLVETAARSLRPAVIIVCAAKSATANDVMLWLRRAGADGSRIVAPVLEGAIRAKLLNAQSLSFSTYLTQRTFVLQKGPTAAK